jgi:outer membrane protein assembly factor BamB
MACLLLAFAGCTQATADPPAGPGDARVSDEDSALAPLFTRTRGSDWPAFLGPTGDGRSPEVGLRAPWPKAGPPIVWQAELGTGYGGPAVSQGRLFHFDRHGDSARLTCRNSETGHVLWAFEYPTDYEDLYGYNNGPRCCPVVDGDRVYTFGAEGILHCLSVADGALVWKLDTAARFGVVQNFFGVGSAPVIEGDLLIVQVGGSPERSRRIPPGQLDRVVGDKSGIVAFDKRTGEVRYQITDELASYAVPTLATIGGRRWCFVFARGGLVGFEPASGQVDFHFPWRADILESVNASNPVVVGDEVFISETYGPGSALLRVRPGGYDEVWTDRDRGRGKAMQTHWNTPIAVDGYLYGSSGRHLGNAELRCIEWATGEVQWSEPDLTRSSLLYVEGHFVCLTEVGELLLLKVNPERFDVVSRIVLKDAKGQGPLRFGPPPLLKEPAWAAPVLAHGLLYVRGDDRLVCLEVIPSSP